MPGAQRDLRDDTARRAAGADQGAGRRASCGRAAEAAERDARFPRRGVRALGGAGLLGLPYPEELGGGGQPYETYLQVVEELASAWLAVGLGVSVHTLSCFPVATRRHARSSRSAGCPTCSAASQLGAYCLSEPGSGSDAAALATRPPPTAMSSSSTGSRRGSRTAAQADFYALFARTSGDSAARDRAAGISCFHVPAATAGRVGGAARAQDGHARVGRPRRCGSTAPGCRPTS